MIGKEKGDLILKRVYCVGILANCIERIKKKKSAKIIFPHQENTVLKSRVTLYNTYRLY